jgi:hypothetical protein
MDDYHGQVHIKSSKEEKINGGINMIEIGKLLQVDETDSRDGRSN